MTQMIHDFMSGYFLWRDAVIAAVTVGILCGWLGVYVVLKRIVFVSATLPQVSGLGIAAAFYIGSFLGPHGHEQNFLLNPWVTALIFSCVAASLFSLNYEHRKLSGETLLGIGYILSSALVLEVLNSPRIVQEAHEIGDVLFGNAVVVEMSSLYVILGVTLALLLVHVLFFKEFVTVLFDPEMAATLGMKVGLWNLVLYLTFAVAVSVATRTLGALPVFGFMVLPPAAALLLTNKLKVGIILSVFIGIFAAAGGYFVSYVMSLPTGATMVVVAALWLIPGAVRLAIGRG
jgi:zinc transport system permease protein